MCSAARAPAAPRGPGGAYDLSERTVLGGKAAKDTACLAVELDGGKLTAAYSDDAGEKIRIVVRERGNATHHTPKLKQAPSR